MKKHYFSTFQLILIAFFAALVVVAKIALRTTLQLPGHSGVFWMAILIVSARMIPRRGAVSLVGLTSGILAAFLGLGDFGALNTLLYYTLTGVTTNLALLLLGKPENLVVAALAGIFGHLGKFLVKYLFGIVSGALVSFVALDLLRSLVFYVIFGALGGVLGALTLVALRKAGFFAYLEEKR
jgi:hypothetical protein